MKKFLFLITILFFFSCGEDDTPYREKGLCDDVTCSNHGKCYVLNDVAKCLCDTGYHAEALECIENGVTNPCTGVTCSGKGTCEDNNGTAICNCENGYHAEGLTCVENNVENPCTGVTCSGKGVCEDVNGAPVCECNTGYHAEGLNCIENPATCDGITCSGHGTCSIVDNKQVCNCDEGYIAQGVSCVEEGQDVISCKELQTTSTRCEATKNTNSQYTLIQGNILSDEKVLVGGDVLVDGNGVIICAQCDCSNVTGYVDASKIVCPNAVVSPGLINAHDHISYTQNAPATWGTERFDHRHDWRKGLRGHTKIPATGSATNSQQQWGEFRNVVAGTTSMAGSGGGTGFLRNVDKSEMHDGVDLGSIHYETFPLNDSDGTFKTADCSYPGGIDNPVSVLANDCYLPHVAEGIDNEARNEFLCVSSTNRGGKDLTERNSAFVHTIGLNGTDATELAKNKTAVIWSPRSNVSLYGNTASVTTYKNVGVLIGIGTDWTYSGSMNIVRELQCASYLNQNYYANTFSFKELWKMATKNNAVALAVSDKIGVIKENRIADIAIFLNDKPDYYQSIIESSPDDVILVLKGGKPLYGDKSLINELPNSTGCGDMESVCGVDKFACIQREAGTTFAAFKQANSGSYMLYSCSTPTNEPSCVPFRPSEYSSSSTDMDKDGVADDVDNCPNIFNPKRPLDGNTQGNADQDAFGDACDVCPLVANSTNCVIYSEYDKDDDGIDDIIDNCPFFSNFDQADRDEDGIGDSCDICPDVIGSVCEISIYSVKQGTIPVGSNVTLEGFVTTVIINAQNIKTGFVIQTAQNKYDENLQSKFSGIYIYLGSGSTLTVPAVGDYVSVTGSVKNYFNELELSPVTAVTKITNHTNTMPVATVVNTADVKTGGALADDYEGVLVKVENVTVTELNPTIHGSDPAADLCVVNNDLRIDNLIYTTMPAFTVGQSFSSITGILMFQREDSKLEPRNAADLIAQ